MLTQVLNNANSKEKDKI